MLTKETILEMALAYADRKAEPETVNHTHRTLSFQEGATWANEQNAAEIAELVEALRQIRSADIAQKINTGVFSIPQPLREKVQNLLSKYE